MSIFLCIIHVYFFLIRRCFSFPFFFGGGGGVPVILMQLTLRKSEFHINFINAVAFLFCPIVKVLELDMIIILNTV